MAKGPNQKLKLLYLAKILSEETDDEHGLTMSEIISALNLYGVRADRKTLYQDLEELRVFGPEVIGEQVGRNWYYHMGARDFELPELKLLVDSVQSAKFITDKKSDELIKKLESLVSKYEAKQLHRQVTITGRIKAMNESIYYNVDMIHEAIGNDCKIRFQYFQWNIQKKPELRKNGAQYHISPWGLMWDDENYYLVGYDSANAEIRHYRVDKMLHLSLSEEKREGRKEFREFNLPRYTKSLFGMFGGKEEKVTIEAENSLAGVMIDRFGKDIFIIPTDDKHFRINVNVTVSKQFFGWIIALGEGVRITSPENVVEQMKEEIRRLSKQYECDL